ncbi:MAG: NAD-dependent succinate-semialdehyde dehydrogenase, partial [Caulobacteraceae bacterium]|nr:NAD-dependent succinate-semialdehyde dehydrogenase [Caulobacteraceae bacterium]
WRAARSGRRFAVVDPATETVLASVADGAPADGLEALEAASAAAAGWAATSPRRRSEILRAAYDLMTARANALAMLITLENGKVLADARAEIAYAADFFRWYAEEAVRAGGGLERAPGSANNILVRREPVGVALLITPWNFPAAMVTRKVGPALAAGCTCVLKPAAETPLTALAIAEILQEAGLPDGVLNVVATSEPGPLVEALLDDPRLRKLSFTGSTAVGRRLLERAARRVVNCSMELGGDAPFIVFDDADLDRAVEGAMAAKMRGGGQACTAANRFFVHRAVFAPFAERLAARMAAVKLGDGLDADIACGPLTTAAGRDKVRRLVDEAMAGGARALVGGEASPGPGFFSPPTVLVDAPAGAAILREEIFGPVAVLSPFDDEAEVIGRANASELGLAAYVFTGDLARGLRVCEALECGMAALNRGVLSDVAAPFGGVKQSGLGREGGHDGLLAFTEPKYIAADW